jgi:hypothetical protein
MATVERRAAQVQAERTFAYDAELARRNLGQGVHTLNTPGNPDAKAIFCPLAGGTVLNCTADGKRGLLWVGEKQIEAHARGQPDRQYNATGGKRRWQGPEGTEASLFFDRSESPEGAEFDFKPWRTPAHMHTKPGTVVSVDETKGAVHFKQEVRGLVNKAGATLDYDLEHTLTMLDGGQVRKNLGNIELPAGVKMVAYESQYKMTNVGQDWSRGRGFAVDWDLTQMTCSDGVTGVAPTRADPSGRVPQYRIIMSDDKDAGGSKIVPPDRLTTTDNAVFIKLDGNRRYKVGIPPERSTGAIAIYDADNRVLTIMQWNKQEGLKSSDFVDSRWTKVGEQGKGEDAFFYNDGPVAGKQLGPFTEGESIAPIRELKRGESAFHTHRNMHFQGPEADLEKIAKAALGVGIEEIKTALRPKPSAGDIPTVKSIPLP